jgi:hypothetical protein
LGVKHELEIAPLDRPLDKPLISKKTRLYDGVLKCITDGAFGTSECAALSDRPQAAPNF